ncbi:hypothetical protein TNIN_264711 [Trichonephila inaurata madagascariensis]|uniref:Uncharacterized protein n=1 Tax=Trichonephila inaurata madagascariensis TaxID=2747483 RepID=A0A8X6WXY3_9ARAC|nr:hypothetical protein TNIN_264711 [Trichonephila inaurata madagascariensis]
MLFSRFDLQHTIADANDNRSNGLLVETDKAQCYKWIQIVVQFFARGFSQYASPHDRWSNPSNGSIRPSFTHHYGRISSNMSTDIFDVRVTM